MIRTVIIDDEDHCVKAIRNALKPFLSAFELVGVFSNVDDAVSGVTVLNPDLVFLDVEIHSKTGFDFLKATSQLTFQIIFTTAYEKYAVRAFKFSALDYLLKPIDEDDFNNAIQRVIKNNTKDDLDQKLEVLWHNLQDNQMPKRITVNTKTDFHVLSTADILYCKSSINYTDIFTKQNIKITSSKTLKYYDGLLTDANFYRVDQSYLVNLDYIKKYTKGKPAYVILTDDTKIKVSLSNKEGFLEKLNSL